jgi:hypothetical protein
MKDYIVESANNKKEFYLYNVPIHILVPFPKHININNVISKIKKSIPFKMIDGLDVIYVGEFLELDQRQISAMFLDGAIYISAFNDFPEITEEVIVKDIVHEIAHMLEEKFNFEIYGDQSIVNEYNAKKKKLVSLLRAEGIVFPGMGTLFFSNDYVDELDNFLLNKLGYDKLSVLTAGLFLSPYSVTSIREYFANVFEEFTNGDRKYLKQISPAAYEKIEELFRENQDG